MSLQKSKGLVIGLVDVMTLYSLIKQESATVIIAEVLKDRCFYKRTEYHTGSCIHCSLYQFIFLYKIKH